MAAVFGTIILATLLFSLLFAGVSYGLFLASLDDSPETPRPSPGELLQSFAGSVAAQLLVIATYPLGRLRPYTGTISRTGRPRVVLVHGLYHNSSAWLFWARPLARLGFTDISKFSYPSFWTTKNKLHHDFDNFMNRVLDQDPAKDVILIGHSLGGLLAATWAASTSRPDRILGVITLGTPFGGSTLARLGMGTLARTLRLRENCALPVSPQDRTEVPKIAIVSSTDNMVLPPKNLIPPEGWEVCRTNPEGHVTMLYSGCTRDRVLAFVTRLAGTHNS